jgi:hypothetical protein
LISFISLPVRGLVASYLVVPSGVYPVQILDGVGADLQSVAMPGLVARVLNGTGRVNVGTVMTAQGAALSPDIGGWFVQALGCQTAFVILGSFALVSFGLWLGFESLLKPECSQIGRDPSDSLADAKL